VKRSNSSRAKFSFGLPFLLPSLSSQRSRAGSRHIAASSSSKRSRPAPSNVASCNAIARGSCSFWLLVAKWPCQKWLMRVRSTGSPCSASHTRWARTRAMSPNAITSCSRSGGGSGAAGAGPATRSTAAATPAATSSSRSDSEPP